MLDLSKSRPVELTQTTLFSQVCESGRFAPHIHPSEALAVVSPCSERGRFNIVTCQDDGINTDLKDVGGLSLNSIRLSIPGIPLPHFIPIIPKDLFHHSNRVIHQTVVGVALADILNKKPRIQSGQYSVPSGATLNREILTNPIFQGKQVILFSTGPDRLIEHLWWRRRDLRFFEKVSRMGFAGVTAMNFSVITGECPFGQALNIKKSVCYAKELDKTGVWAIPHVYAINRYQRERWKNWLRRNPTIQVVTINSQLQKAQSQGMKDVHDTAKFLLTETPVSVIIHGGTSGIHELSQRFKGRVHFAASGPLKRCAIWKDRPPSVYIEEFRKKLNPSS